MAREMIELRHKEVISWVGHTTRLFAVLFLVTNWDYKLYQWRIQTFATFASANVGLQNSEKFIEISDRQ